MTIAPVKVGVIGAGTISAIYLENSKRFESLNVVACADLDPDRARARAEQYGVPRACSVEELLADPTIELVLNLTIPNAHAAVALAALESGKSVYNEKPLAITREDGRRLLDLAKEQDLLIGGAPDTFLGGGHQTCRKLIDDGAIGVPVAATAFLANHGPEHWHPDPAFYYDIGGGPMFDMGPYYLTALVNMIGPIARVTGSTRISFPERTVSSEPKYGQTIHVKTPTHIAGVLDFTSGAIGTVITSFDVWSHHLPRLEVYGSEGTLSVPDPNRFGDQVYLRIGRESEWTEVPLTHGYDTNSRGLGVADMAYALRSGRPHRASGDLCYHVLDAMHALHDASDEGRHIELTSTCERPAALPLDLPDGKLDE